MHRLDNRTDSLMVLRHTSRGVIRTPSDLDDTCITDIDDRLSRQMTIGSATEDRFATLGVEPLRHKSASMRVLRHSSFEENNTRQVEENGDETDLTAVLRACKQ